MSSPFANCNCFKKSFIYPKFPPIIQPADYADLINYADCADCVDFNPNKTSFKKNHASETHLKRTKKVESVCV